MATATIKRLTTAVRQRAESANAAYAALVVKAARDEPVSPDEAEQVLAAAGMTLDDLGRDVEAAVRRIGLRAKLDAEGKLVQDREQLVKKAEAAKAKLQKAEEAYDAECRPLEFRIKAVDAAIAEAHAARQELITAAPADRVAKLATARTAVDAAGAVVAGKEEYFERLRAAANQPETDGTHDYRVQVADAKDRLPHAESDLAAARAGHEQAIEAMQAAEAELLVP
jgi:hypothetical protein